jgi:hypothetical protein
LERRPGGLTGQNQQGVLTITQSNELDE